MSAVIQDIQFEEESHTYSHNGVKIPGVTSVLDRWSGLEHVNPQILAEAALFGTHVHDACDLYNRGELDEDDLNDNSHHVWEYFRGWVKFLEDTGAVVVESELKVHHPTLGYAGTLDNIVNLKKTNRIVDIKTGTALPKSVGPQVEAYNQAYKAMTGNRLMKRYCCHLKPYDYTLHALTNPRDWDIFKAALTMHRWYTGE